MVTNDLRAYYAGLVDGEGYIGGHSFRQGSSGKKNYDIRVSIGLKSNTENGVLDRAKKTWGGSIYITKYGIKVWDIKGKVCEQFLRDIYPYMVIKPDQADVAFEIRATKIYRGRRKVPKKVMQRRKELHKKLKDLHQQTGFALKKT